MCVVITLVGSPTDQCGHPDRTLGESVGRCMDDTFCAGVRHRDAGLYVIVPVEVRITRLVVSDLSTALNEPLTTATPLVVSVCESRTALDTRQSSIYTSSRRLLLT